MPKARTTPLTQYAALPWRKAADGRIEVMLITSRETRRWVIAKGWPITGLNPGDSAAQEALEEAGVTGDVWAEPVGAYDYEKRLKGGELQPVEVEVFPLRVLEELEAWPEKGQRERRWFAAAEAAGLVAEPRLAELIREFGGR
ncbi:NUDIX hydrolase [Phenylobacterium terrae]|uniref:NUDIX hydrolase n=1 Tax=Phenylobacterium terrae TaxID=2665495 RepID=A0ABW4N1C2_9CAUL